MLGRRFAYDARPVIRLNQLQYAVKGQVEQKVATGNYAFEDVACCLCAGTNFELLAEKDRFGLYMPTVVCRGCGLVQTNPRMNSRALAEFYEVEYRRLYEGVESPTQDLFNAYRNKGNRIYSWLEARRLFPRSPSDLSVFEVGCAAGGILQYFREAGCRVAGVDLGREYVEFGRSQYGLDLRVGTLADVRFDSPPDIVILSHVLEHLLDPVEEMRRVISVLAPTGIVYVEVPGIRNLVRTYNMDFLVYLQNAHTYHFTLKTLNNLMQAAGFELVTGTEDVFSVFRPRASGEAALDPADRDSVVSFLRMIERRRRLWPVPPYKFHGWASRAFARLRRILGRRALAPGDSHGRWSGRRSTCGPD